VITAANQAGDATATVVSDVWNATTHARVGSFFGGTGKD